ncbi:MAG: cytochrome c [Proteobacteria bacterium]|nr:cytochrome c [Pseudomonadota bacterium]
MPRLTTGLLVAAGLSIAATIPVASIAQSGSPAGVQTVSVGQPCAACHLPSGAGVPGAFPPLRANFVALAKLPEGRRYIVSVVTRGLSGAIAVDGKRFIGNMPAQALGDDQIAKVLNGILGGAARPFTPREVAALRTGAAKLGPNEVARLRPSGASR